MFLEENDIESVLINEVRRAWVVLACFGLAPDSVSSLALVDGRVARP